MEKKYWIGRKRSALAMAVDAASSEARLIHYELAGRYSVKAATCAPLLAAPATLQPLPLPLSDPLAAPHTRGDPA